MPDRASLLRHATWVGVKTLRERPKVVGETKGGALVFEVRSVRLVLTDDARHFNRLTDCSKCGREVAGAAVFRPADLDRPTEPALCKSCLPGSVTAGPPPRERRTPTSQPPAAPVAEAPEEAPEPAEATLDARLKTIEAQWEAAVGLAEPIDVDGLKSAETRLQDALRQGLAEVRAEMSAALERGADLAMVDEEARRRTEKLTQAVQAQQGRLLSLSAVLDEVRTEMRRLAASTEGSRAQAELERWIDERIAGARIDVTALEQRLRDHLTPLARRADLNQELARSHGALERRIEETAASAAAQAAAVEQQLRAEISDLRQLVGALRHEIEASLGAPVQAGLAAIVQAVQELARARDEIRASAEQTARTLVSAVEEEGGRVRSLELRVDKAIERLTAVLDHHHQQLRDVVAMYRLEAGVDAALSVRSTPGELVVALERQLQAAEGRLAELTAGRWRAKT